MTFRDVFRPGGGEPEESSHLHDGGDISGRLPYVRSVGGVNIPGLDVRVADVEAQAFMADEDAEFSALTEKTAPVDADIIPIEDSAASDAKKHITVGTLRDLGPRGVLGYAEVTSSQTGITTEVDVTGASVTVTVGSSRLIRVSCMLQIQGTASGGEVRIRSYMDNSTERRLVTHDLPGAGDTTRYAGFALYEPSAGSRTFKLTAEGNNGEVSISALAAVPTLLVVEDIGAA